MDHAEGSINGRASRSLPSRGSFWESYAAWNKCLNDEGKKAAFIAGYVVGWERNARPPLPSKNVVTVDF